MALTQKNGGWIEVICGPMFSGKTEELIRRLIRAQIAKQKVAIFKPALDDRYSEDYIVSHNQRKIKSIIISKAKDIIKYSQDSDVIGIDEAQFCDLDLIDICKNLAKKGKRIVVAGLEKDFQALPFGPMPQLLVDAEYVTKVNAICMNCGDPANFSQRITQEKKQVVIGEIDKYEARCRSCFTSFSKGD